MNTSGAMRVGVVIVGAGFSGIGLAIRLRQQGIDDFVILERATDLGGTWRDNGYPGCACDVPSALYSLDCAPNPSWSHRFSPQAEIWAYLRETVAKFDLEKHMRFNQQVTAASWDDEFRRWTIAAGTTTWSAKVLVLATGPLSEPMVPALPGLASFTGPAFHSAQWDHTFDMRGKRVAVIGTGASAIQFVPKLQPQVAHLLLMQRTPPWVIPRGDHAIPAWRQSLYRVMPSVQRLQRDALYLAREVTILPFRHPRIARAVEWAARRHLERQIADPVLRSKLTPEYTIGCKRILLSDDYYPALAQPNVEVSTDRVTAVRPAGIETADGRMRPLDAIIFGTGFRVTDPPLAPHILGRSGVSLAESWRGSPTAYMGTSYTGFPNLFFLLGPNTGLGHSSVLLIVEAQIEHVLQLLRELRARDAESVEPTASAQARYVAWIDAELSTTVWNRGGCRSWYIDATGRNSALWPGRVGTFRRMTSRLRLADYQFTPTTNGTRVAPE